MDIEFTVEADVNSDDVVTTFKYPVGTAYVSAMVSSGSMSTDGKIWMIESVTGGNPETITITIQITDVDRFNQGDKTVRGETRRLQGETDVTNNIAYKLS